MPIGLAYFASTLQTIGYPCKVVDAFGENPNQYWKEGDFIFRGLLPSEIVAQINNNAGETPLKIIFVYVVSPIIFVFIWYVIRSRKSFQY